MRDELLRFKMQVLEQVKDDPEFRPTFDTRQGLLRRYAGRAMFDGSPAAATRFAETVDQTEQWFTGQSGLDLLDPRACAAVLSSMTFGVLAMQDQIARVLGEDPLSPRVQERIALAYADIYSPRCSLRISLTGFIGPSAISHPPAAQSAAQRRRKTMHDGMAQGEAVRAEAVVKTFGSPRARPGRVRVGETHGFLGICT